MELPKIIVYDTEVFAHDWCICFQEVFVDNPKTWSFYTGQNKQVAEFITNQHSTGTYFAGYNSKHYDKGIVSAICFDATPEELKELNDYIIVQGEPWWTWDKFQGHRFNYNDIDLMDDTAMGTSLKSIESQMGWAIRESSVPFDTPYKLTRDEMKEVLQYCEYDVESTAKLCELRRDYLETKAYLSSISNIPLNRAMSMTNAKLTAEYLRGGNRGTVKEREADERDYIYPHYESFPIPEEVEDFFARGKDKTVDYQQLFTSKLDIDVGGCPVTLAFGGIHGAVPRSAWKADKDHKVLNYDVASLYPSIIIQYDLMSRYTEDKELYKRTRDIRVKAKNSGDKATSNALKLVLNTTYGVFRQKFSKLYDPRQARSVCVTGQVVMLGLAMRCLEIPGLEMIQLNTDGIMFRIPNHSYDLVVDLMHEWERVTGLEMEEDDIAVIYQRDVNNYACRMTDGHDKLKGGVLNRGIKVGAFGVNNDALIVAQAVYRNLLDDVDIADVINGCDDPSQFQLTAKASHKYSKVYQTTITDPIECQKCNRVYATTNHNLGTLYKVKKETGRAAKIAGLPAHCLIANEEPPAINEIDKQWYIDLAKRQIEEFLPDLRLFGDEQFGRKS